jgi:hypothetical protein
MSVNLAYYQQLVESIKAALELLKAVAPIVTQLMQFAEDHMPASPGGDKLKFVLTTLRGTLTNGPDLGAEIDSIWGVFSGLVSGFAVLQKSIGAVKAATPPSA